MDKTVKKPAKSPKTLKKEESKKDVHKKETSAVEENQPEVSIGLVGHVDHGKTTLTKALTGKWTDTHSEEIKRGITIRLGYADILFYYCNTCKRYTVKKECEECKGKTEAMRKVSFIDAPGHESLMATMLSGAAIIDGAILLVAANEECPQPQTKEHLMALEMIGMHQIVIAQNKIDLVTAEQAIKNHEQIKQFVKGTVAENAPIVPISAQHNVNIEKLIEAIQDVVKTPERDPKKEAIMFIARSFDVNKPGTQIASLSGGVLGGAIKQGVLKVGQEIEIRPGLGTEREGKKTYQPLITEITAIHTGGKSVKEAYPGGSLGIQTKLDPYYVKSDSLTGNILGEKGKIPSVWSEFDMKPQLLERVVGSKEELKVDPIKRGEPLMININAAATVGVVSELKKDIVHVRLKIPVCCDQNAQMTLSRMLGNRWRLIGTAKILK